MDSSRVPQPSIISYWYLRGQVLRRPSEVESHAYWILVAFRRPLGIARWAVTPGPAGTFGLAAQLAFTTHKVEDVRKLLDAAADWSGRTAQGSVVAGVDDGAVAPTVAPAPPASSPTGTPVTAVSVPGQS